MYGDIIICLLVFAGVLWLGNIVGEFMYTLLLNDYIKTHDEQTITEEDDDI